VYVYLLRCFSVLLSFLCSVCFFLFVVVFVMVFVGVDFQYFVQKVSKKL
jgi:hypothetical protein